MVRGRWWQDKCPFLGHCGDAEGSGFTDPGVVKRRFSMNLKREPQSLLNLHFSPWPPGFGGYFCNVVKHRNLQCLLSLPLLSQPSHSYPFFFFLNHVLFLPFMWPLVQERELGCPLWLLLHLWARQVSLWPKAHNLLLEQTEEGQAVQILNKTVAVEQQILLENSTVWHLGTIIIAI